MAEYAWIVITPKPGRRGFEPQLLVGLVGPNVPAHIWVDTPELRGFIMRSAEYQHWMESTGPIEVVSPQHVGIYGLDCGDEIDRLMQQLQTELSEIVKGWSPARTT